MTATVASRTAARLDEVRAEGRSALIGYLPVGFPDVPGSVDAVRAMIDAGVDVVELGVPYSDPVMDGPVIQRSVEQALAGGVRVADTLRTVEAVAATGVPILLMTYWNPVVRYGVDAFARDLASAGGAGAEDRHCRRPWRAGAGADRLHFRARHALAARTQRAALSRDLWLRGRP